MNGVRGPVDGSGNNAANTAKLSTVNASTNASAKSAGCHLRDELRSSKLRGSEDFRGIEEFLLNENWLGWSVPFVP